jgi:hypothetical protein
MLVSKTGLAPTQLIAGEPPMPSRLFLLSLALATSGCASPPDVATVSPIVGTWRLETRVDRTADGRELVEPTLGRDPVALLIYDSRGNVSAQLMKRNRSDAPPQPSAFVDPNNSAAQGGYDAYFGTYVVGAGTVTHVLQAALNPKDVGRQLTRHFRIEGDRLEISFGARASDGSEVARVLMWRRAAP